MVGSGVFAGVFALEQALATPDNNTPALTLGAELERIGFAGAEPAGGRKVAAYFEAHIEQGPILEAARNTIGVVTGAQGQRWYEITVTGQEAHAGPTPMPRRKDALVGAARMIDAVNRIGHAYKPSPAPRWALSRSARTRATRSPAMFSSPSISAIPRMRF